MEKLNHQIDIHSTTILSDIAMQIQKPLLEIKRIQEYRSANHQTDYANLNEVVLQNSEAIENLIAEMIKIEKEKQIEIKINDSLQFPELINKYRDKSVVLFKEDVEWLISLETLFIEHISLKKFDLQLFLSKLFMSERSFFRKVKLNTGLTPYKYFSKIKLHYAKYLIEKKECKSINMISEKVGINDQSYFTHKFSKLFHLTPRQIMDQNL
jgi:AraC-like DNA-binding protein